MTNVLVLQKNFETYLRIKKLIRERYKYNNLVQPTDSSLIIQSKGMEPREYDSLSDTAIDIWVSRQTLGFRDKPSLMLISTRNPSPLGGKVEPKYSSSRRSSLEARCCVNMLEIMKAISKSPAPRDQAMSNTLRSQGPIPMVLALQVMVVLPVKQASLRPS